MNGLVMGKGGKNDNKKEYPFKKAKNTLNSCATTKKLLSIRKKRTIFDVLTCNEKNSNSPPYPPENVTKT